MGRVKSKGYANLPAPRMPQVSFRAAVQDAKIGFSAIDKIERYLASAERTSGLGERDCKTLRDLYDLGFFDGLAEVLS